MPDLNSIEGFNIEKINDIPSNNISKINDIGANFDIAPIGLILPFNDTSIPAGWERFTPADNRLIIGAGGSYSPGTTGGSPPGTSAGSFNNGSTTSGVHNGPFIDRSYAGPGIPAGGAPHISPVSWDAGDHSHNFTGSAIISQFSRTQYLLIRSTSVVSKLPPNSMVLSSSSIPGLTNISSSTNYLGSGSTITETSLSGYINGNTSTSGVHGHWGFEPDRDGSITALIPVPFDNGDHTHTGTVSYSGLSENYRRVLLSLWTNASAEYDLSTGIIGMWESLTPPDKWSLCDGNNGTPDLRNSFIKVTSSGGENTVQVGDNTVTCSVNTTFGGNATHHHQLNQTWSVMRADPVSFYHTTIDWNHSHSVSATRIFSFLPSYYALSFIMKTE